MLAVTLCLLGVLLILLINETLWRDKLLHGEMKRKFVHILATTFMAFWPWIISFKAIQLIGIAMVVVLLINRQLKILHYLGNVRQKTYGEVFLALAVTVAALLTDNKVFYAIALLHVAFADGLAAVIGTKYGKKWKYTVFHQNKTVIGSMVFWVVSLIILGFGLPFAQTSIPFEQYPQLLLFLPPILTVIENVGSLGLDNLAVPVAVILILQIAST
jgi:phytol kinase